MASSLLVLGAVLTSVSGVAGSVVAGVGAAWEIGLFVASGLQR